ncbi:MULTISPECIES: hypothetical protein [Acidovorax]|jgi:hypothetical protein|uniref:hypothetical protein n=1 Tax=Acidovorax TaxID=12916 RepID=UPI0006FEE1AB|nr:MULTISPECIES: hypothetical protein [Acidovorax]KQW27761.1 hypothetical protein ASC83_23045 [Acidovorax sp. Root402]
MANELRLVAVHVEEPSPGTYEWVITEQRSGDQWVEIDRATGGRHRYKEAMADGLVSLEQMIDDLDEGPRWTRGRSDATQKEGLIATAHSDAEETAKRPQPKPEKVGYFGFGPIR